MAGNEELLARIDERVQAIQGDVQEIKAEAKATRGDIKALEKPLAEIGVLKAQVKTQWFFIGGAALAAISGLIARFLGR